MRKYLFFVVPPVWSLLAGCLAHGADMGGAVLGQPVTLDWGSFVTAYGPMTVMLGWCFYDARERRKEDQEHRAEWKKLLRTNIETLAQVRDALSQARIDDDKHRTAIYKMADEMKEIRAVVNAVCDAPSRNTRIMTRERTPGCF